MNAVVLGSKMKVETFPPPSSEYPMYVVRCPPDSYELSYIHLTAAHEEDGWKVVNDEQQRQEGRGDAASLPSPEVIKIIATEYGYEERRDEASSTLFFKDTSTNHNPTLINVFYTTGGVMTKVSHPTSGYNQLWRADAYNSVASLATIFENPRVHTGKGYRNACKAIRGCVNCGLEKKRGEFSSNQWRKGAGQSKCTSCVQKQQSEREGGVGAGGAAVGGASNEIAWQSLVDSITCDAEGCNNSSPTIRCDSCQMFYYCSEMCKRRHQGEHSQECLSVEEMRYRCQVTESDTNINSGLCNAKPATLAMMKGSAMASQLAGVRTIDALLKQAEYIHQADEEWAQAMHIYQEIMKASYGFEDHTEMASASQYRQVFMGMSRCLYKLGDYEKCINAGEAAIEMNRHFPQIHRYVALAQMAKGDPAEAVKTMKHAVLFEAPWCDETVQSNKDLLREWLWL
jgi:hypothetical protein